MPSGAGHTSIASSRPDDFCHFGGTAVDRDFARQAWYRSGGRRGGGRRVSRHLFVGGQGEGGMTPPCRNGRTRPQGQDFFRLRESKQEGHTRARRELPTVRGEASEIARCLAPRRCGCQGSSHQRPPRSDAEPIGVQLGPLGVNPSPENPCVGRIFRRSPGSNVWVHFFTTCPRPGVDALWDRRYKLKLAFPRLSRSTQYLLAN